MPAALDRLEARLVAWALVGVCLLEVSGTFDVATTLTGLPLYIVTLGATSALAAWVFARHRTVLTWPIIGFGLFVIANAISYLNSSLDPAVTAEGLSDVLKTFVFVVALAVLASRKVPWRALGLALTIPTGLIGYASAANEFLLGKSQTFLGYDTVTAYEGVGFEAARHAGPMPDPNFWGRELVAVIPFTLALALDAWRRRHTQPRRAVWVGLISAWAFLGQLLAVYLTGSRGTYLALALGVAVFLVVAGLDLRRVLIVGAVAIPAALMVPGIGTRVFSFTFTQQGLAQTAAEDGSFLERLATQRVALAMARDHLVTGVGPNGYFSAFGQYGAATQQALSRVVAPHNLYLGTAAELGLLGLCAWLAMLGLALAAAVAAVRRRAVQLPYASAVLAGLLAWSAASIFLHASHIRILVVLVVLAAAVARETATAPARELIGLRAWQRRRPRLPVRALGLASVMGLIVAAALGLLSMSWGVTYQAQSSGYLSPTTSNTYLLDLRTRSAVITTYAVLAEIERESQVDVQGNPSSGLMNLTANARSETQARQLATQSIQSGTVLAQRSTLNDLYRPNWGPVSVVPVPTPAWEILAWTFTGFGLGYLGALAIALQRPRTHENVLTHWP